MKTGLAVLTVILIGLSFSCKKDNNSDNPANKTPLAFRSLTASDTLITVTDIVTIAADASGDELIYSWIPEYGNILGSGSQVQWTVCHSDRFTITCEVADKYGDKISKSVDINVKN
jgi:hypothetical protein